MPGMPLGDLTQAWVAASAALPLDWILIGVWLDPDNPSQWQATAAGPLDGQTVHGRGGQPERALRRLAEELRRIKGPMTG